MKKYLLSLAVMAMGATLLTGCLGDDSNSNTPTEIPVTKGVFIINNGSSYQSIDGSLTYINYAAMTPSAQQNVYKMVNGESLGGTPNDVLVYGQKVYITGFDENTIFVLDTRNSKELKKISTTDLLGEAEGRGPRRAAAFDGKVYFTTYGDGDKGYVAAIDTTNFALQKKYQVGSHPEGLTFGIDDANVVTLYVANSDWSMGNGSISKIDLASGSVTNSEYEKVKNPQEIAVAGNVLYVLDYGHYDDAYNQVDAGVYMINNNNVSLVIPNATGMAASGYYIYAFSDPFGGTTGPSFSVYDIRSNFATKLNLSGDSAHPIVSPAAIAVDPNTGNIFIASRQKDPDTGYPAYAMPGFVNVYQGYGLNTNPGQFVESFQTGVEPHKIEFVHGTTKIVLQ
jgi:DNA-binding beta-propeller fold protein YncE